MRNKIVVFGGSGFIGSHVADHLSEAGYEVIIYDIKDSPYLRDDQEIVIGDILDLEKVDNVTRDAKVVYNFAALSDLNEALDKPLETIEVNLLGTVKILEACRKNKIERFIYASTVYVHSREGGFYRCSKLATEQYIQEFHNQYGLEYCVLRYGSLYGPRSGPDNGLWRILDLAVTTGEIKYVGHPETFREYIHVDDAARASLMALGDDFKNQHIVLTGQEPMKVFDLLKMIGEILEIKKDIQFQDTSYVGHYIRTPYSYNEKVGKKYIPSMHVDLGQGILQMINEIKNSTTDQKD
jgi:UDP-glucose 4-epimerase